MIHGSIDITNVLPFLLTLAAGGGVGVVLLAYAIRKLFGMESDKAIHFMVMGVSAVMTLASYILQYKNLPVSVLGISGPAIYGFSQAVYKTAKVLADLLAKVADSLHGPSRVATAVESSTAGIDAAVAAFTAPAQAAPEASAAPATNELDF